MKKLILLFLLVIVLIGFLVALNFRSQESPIAQVVDFDSCVAAGNPAMESYPPQCRDIKGVTYTQDIGNELEKMELIRVDDPRPNSTVTNPIIIRGQARGLWYFEADFSIRLVDEQGNELGVAIAQAQEDWMTEEFVPFHAELMFAPQGTVKGTLILERSNPSGLPENDDSLMIPVRLGESNTNSVQETKSVQLYYYDQSADPDVSCEDFAVQPVTRTVPEGQALIHDVVTLLLQGELTEEEQAKGFTTEFPLDGVELVGAALLDGVLILEFIDPQNSASGGSCRVNLLRAQVEKTVRQFPDVTEVRFEPDIFQP